MGAMRAAVGVVLTLTAAVGYVHGIVFLQDWQDDRIEAQAQEVVDTFIEPAESTLGDLTTDKVAPPEPTQQGQVDVSVVIEPLPGWEDEVCYEDEPCWDCDTMGNGLCGPPPVAEVPSEPSAEVGSTWEGLLVGDIIVCPPGSEVSTDVTPGGMVWAGCM